MAKPPARGAFLCLAIVESGQLVALAQSGQITHPLGAIALPLHTGLLQAGVSSGALTGALQAVLKIAQLSQTQIGAATLDLTTGFEVVA